MGQGMKLAQSTARAVQRHQRSWRDAARGQSSVPKLPATTTLRLAVRKTVQLFAEQGCGCYQPHAHTDSVAPADLREWSCAHSSR